MIIETQGSSVTFKTRGMPSTIELSPQGRSI